MSGVGHMTFTGRTLDLSNPKELQSSVLSSFTGTWTEGEDPFKKV